MNRFCVHSEVWLYEHGQDRRSGAAGKTGVRDSLNRRDGSSRHPSLILTLSVLYKHLVNRALRKFDFESFGLQHSDHRPSFLAIHVGGRLACPRGHSNGIWLFLFSR